MGVSFALILMYTIKEVVFGNYIAEVVATGNKLDTDEDTLKEISILNSNLQIIYENYKKKNISKEAYLKEKSLIQDKKILLESKLKELKSEEIDLKKEFDGNSLDKNNLLKAYVDSSIDKIVVSRSGEREIVEK